MKTSLARAAAFLAFVLAAPALADEGMWTFDNPPAKQLKERYGFEPTRRGSTPCPCTATGSTRTCAWSSHPSSRRRSSAETRTTSRSRATTSTSA
jgi:hypothetical protein